MVNQLFERSLKLSRTFITPVTHWEVWSVVVLFFKTLLQKLVGEIETVHNEILLSSHSSRNTGEGERITAAKSMKELETLPSTSPTRKKNIRFNKVLGIQENENNL